MNLKLMRALCHIEGASLLVLLFIAMPMKYVYGNPELVRIVGMAHGLLFVAFMAAAFIAQDKFGWSVRKVGLAFLASTIPFGTFAFDRKLFDGQ